MSEPRTIGVHLCGHRLCQATLRRTGTQIVVETSEHPLAGRDPAAAGAPTAASLSATNDGVTCIASLPTPDVLSRCWTFPAADDEQLRRMIAHRLEAELPIPLDELTWGYRTNGHAASPDHRCEAFAQAARTERVQQTVARFSAAGIRIDTLTTEAEALGALYRHGITPRPESGGGAAEALVLATRDSWLVAVLIGGMVRALRRLRVEPGQSELVCRQCQQAIEAHVSRRELHRVLWCAAGELSPGRQALERCLGVTVAPVEPAEHLVDAGGARITSELLAGFGPAIGLALAGVYERDRLIRFAGHATAEAKPRGRAADAVLAHPGRWAVTAASLLVLVAALHVGALQWEASAMRRLLAAHEQAGSPMAALQPKIRAMQRLETYRIDVERYFADLCRSVPDSITLSSIQLARDRRLVIKGTAKNPNAIFELADALRKGDRFATVNPERTEPGQGGGFTITAELVGIHPLPSSVGRGQPWR